ncbi:hypothetical protein IF2G_09337 [Cordyceps javanica]|nr:hypothetical protein IF2G_09337 [Cordyceps javanica]
MVRNGYTADSSFVAWCYWSVVVSNKSQRRASLSCLVSTLASESCWVRVGSAWLGMHIGVASRPNLVVRGLLYISCRMILDPGVRELALTTDCRNFVPKHTWGLSRNGERYL